MDKKAIFEWSATAVLIIAVSLTSFNIYPLNIFISILSNIMWAVLAIWWRKISLLSIQIFLTIIYLAGLYKYYT